MVALLLGVRAQLNSADDAGVTALQEACIHGHDQIIQRLAKKGATCDFSSSTSPGTVVPRKDSKPLLEMFAAELGRVLRQKA